MAREWTPSLDRAKLPVEVETGETHMPFLKTHDDNTGPGAVFSTYPEIYRHWAEMGHLLINGPSPLSSGEREMIQAFVAGLIECNYALVAHTAAAVACGIDEGVVGSLLDAIDTAPVADKLKPLLSLVRKLTLTPQQVAQADIDAVLAAGWGDKGLHDAIALTARMTFMSRIIFGHGFVPMSPERAKTQAEHRAKVGYVALYPKLDHSSLNNR